MTRLILRSTAIALAASAWIFGCSSSETTEPSTSSAATITSIGCGPGQTKSCQYDPRLKTETCTTCANHLNVCPNEFTVNVNNVCVPCGSDGMHQCTWGCDSPLTVRDGICRPCDGTGTPECLDTKFVSYPDGDGGVVVKGTTQRICADDLHGEAVIDREWDPWTCGRPPSPTANVVRVPMP